MLGIVLKRLLFYKMDLLGSILNSMDSNKGDHCHRVTTQLQLIKYYYYY
jgi:hypothetical protein